MIDVEVIYDTANKTYSIMTINHKTCVEYGSAEKIDTFLFDNSSKYREVK